MDRFVGLPGSIVLNKTTMSEIVRDLVACVETFDYLCLMRSHKWCFELLHSIEDAFLSDDSVQINVQHVREVVVVVVVI